MKRNIGSVDKAIRVIAGLAIIGLGLYYKSWLGLIGIVPLTTSLMGWCPPYALLGINTCGAKASEEQPVAGPPDAGGDGEG